MTKFIYILFCIFVYFVIINTIISLWTKDVSTFDQILGITLLVLSFMAGVRDFYSVVVAGNPISRK